MLITLCYSVLTWMQSRQRTEIIQWIQDCLINEGNFTLVFIRHDSPKGQGPHLLERPASASSFYYSALPEDSQYSSAWSVDTISRCSSAFSTPRREPSTPIVGMKKSLSFDSTADAALISTLCFNHNGVKLRRLLWAEDNSRALVLQPKQIVELHDWTAFKGTEEVKQEVNYKTFRILLEAEPGQLQKQSYRKFASFGEVVAWRWGGDLGLILQSDKTQLIELMHIFRLGQIVLEGGWRIFRLTTIGTEGAVGTIISRPDLCTDKALTPFDLRRLSSGAINNTHYQSLIYRPFTVVTPTCLSTGIFERVANHTTNSSRHDITTISEESTTASNGGEEAHDKKLLNWYERSPRKRSVTVIPTFEKAVHTPRRRSFCPGSLLSSNAGKSSSLVSLVLFKQALSVEEQDEEENIPLALRRPSQTGSVPSSKSHESLSTLTKGIINSGASTPAKLLSPTGISRSVVASPRKMPKKSPLSRIGKPPNILILCDDAKKREQIGEMLKKMLANDRYAVYDIRWDQLDVGGWSEQTALLVLAGNIPSDSSRLLQYLGDGGRLLAWCCSLPPFGPLPKNDVSNGTKSILEYGTPSRVTKPVSISSNLWPSFQKILETTDSEGYSRPLTANVWAKVKGTGDTVVLQLDGGALGGKAIFSQVEFEKCLEDDDGTALLSQLLSQHLEIDCSPIKTPEYTIGYLLGDHMKIQDFLSLVPSTMQQTDLTLEFSTPRRGEKGSLPSHMCFPIHSLECPLNFSTLDFFENLETKELGRLVIYTDIITSTMKVVTGKPLRHGMTVIARRQTDGKGRGRNIWLSPEGCALFTVQLVVNMDSQMGRRLSLLQHLAALSVILAVPSHKEINLRVKWPNDIYAGDQKVGGVLVESRLEGKEAIVNVGVGFNVSNAYPTMCLNSLIFPDFQPPPSSTSTSNTIKQDKIDWRKKGYWTTEKLIAKSLTELEKLVEKVEKPLGLEDVLEIYEDNWVHHTSLDDELSLVNVEASEGEFAECRIAGIDEYGFLRVVDTTSGNIFSVRPDGNSFDIANRLIAIKD